MSQCTPPAVEREEGNTQASRRKRKVQLIFISLFFFVDWSQAQANCGSKVPESTRNGNQVRSNLVSAKIKQILRKKKRMQTESFLVESFLIYLYKWTEKNKKQE